MEPAAMSFVQQVRDLEAFVLLSDHDEAPPPVAPKARPPPEVAECAAGDGGKAMADLLSLQPLREQDRLLPVANVAHLMASELPSGGKVSRDSKLFMQEVVSEFIGFVTSEANDVCMLNKQKAITLDDVLTALANLGARPAPHCRARLSSRRHVPVRPRVADRMHPQSAPGRYGAARPVHQERRRFHHANATSSAGIGAVAQACLHRHPAEATEAARGERARASHAPIVSAKDTALGATKKGL